MVVDGMSRDSGAVMTGHRSVHTCWYTRRMSSRERLTDAMAELFWERGYAATSPRNVLVRTEVGQGSMYHHFTGKHDLALQTLTSVTAEVAAESELLDGAGAPLERMMRYLTRPREGIRGCRAGRMTQDPQLVEDAELIAVVAGAFDTIIDRWRRVIVEAVADGELSETVVPYDLAYALVAVIQGGYVLARARGAQERTPRFAACSPCSTPLATPRRRITHPTK
ncbi:MAG: TetR/AcrR family transcriptional regulator [Rhodococcus sp. (in: high G+C Gram-positive bacteria)]|nr:MAG: TetR/AcrR family transcriptional regulator [Rhodococcus sp. (in: high G+C Gram-positive bacteria)]